MQNITCNKRQYKIIKKPGKDERKRKGNQEIRSERNVTLRRMIIQFQIGIIAPLPKRGNIQKLKSPIICIWHKPEIKEQWVDVTK